MRHRVPPEDIHRTPPRGSSSGPHALMSPPVSAQQPPRALERTAGSTHGVQSTTGACAIAALPIVPPFPHIVEDSAASGDLQAHIAPGNVDGPAAKPLQTPSGRMFPNAAGAASVDRRIAEEDVRGPPHSFGLGSLQSALGRWVANQVAAAEWLSRQRSLAVYCHCVKVPALVGAELDVPALRGASGARTAEQIRRQARDVLSRHCRLARADACFSHVFRLPPGPWP